MAWIKDINIAFGNPLRWAVFLCRSSPAGCIRERSRMNKSTTQKKKQKRSPRMQNMCFQPPSPETPLERALEKKSPHFHSLMMTVQAKPKSEEKIFSLDTSKLPSSWCTRSRLWPFRHTRAKKKSHPARENPRKTATNFSSVPRVGARTRSVRLHSFFSHHTHEMLVWRGVDSFFGFCKMSKIKVRIPSYPQTYQLGVHLEGMEEINKITLRFSNKTTKFCWIVWNCRIRTGQTWNHCIPPHLPSYS